MKFKKVSMNLSNRSLSSIDEISDLIHEESGAKVIASCLEIAKLFLTEIHNDSQIIIKDKKGETKEVKLII